MRLRFNTGMTFQVDADKSVHLVRHNAMTYTIVVAGVGSQLIQHDLMCPFSPDNNPIAWVNWHIRKSQEVPFEFIPNARN